MDVLSLKDQSLSSVLSSDFQICDYCHIVDKDRNRIKIGNPCPMCKQPNKGGHMYFDASVHILIDLMQESFHAKPWEAMSNESFGAHYVSVGIFFCSLKEALLYRFIRRILLAQKIPKRVQKRLLDDNNSHSQRMNNLFPCLTGKNWKEAIKELNQHSSLEFGKLSDF